MLHDRLKKRRHVFAVFVQFAHGKTVFRAGVNNWEIELLVGCFQFDEEIENLVQDSVWTRVFLSTLLMTTTGFSLFSIALPKQNASAPAAHRAHRQQAARRPPFS